MRLPAALAENRGEGRRRHGGLLGRQYEPEGLHQEKAHGEVEPREKPFGEGRETLSDQLQLHGRGEDRQSAAARGGQPEVPVLIAVRRDVVLSRPAGALHDASGQHLEVRSREREDPLVLAMQGGETRHEPLDRGGAPLAGGGLHDLEHRLHPVQRAVDDVEGEDDLDRHALLLQTSAHGSHFPPALRGVLAPFLGQGSELAAGEPGVDDRVGRAGQLVERRGRNAGGLRARADLAEETLRRGPRRQQPETVGERQANRLPDLRALGRSDERHHPMEDLGRQAASALDLRVRREEPAQSAREIAAVPGHREQPAHEPVSELRKEAPLGRQAGLAEDPRPLGLGQHARQPAEDRLAGLGRAFERREQEAQPLGLASLERVRRLIGGMRQAAVAGPGHDPHPGVEPLSRRGRVDERDEQLRELADPPAPPLVLRQHPEKRVAQRDPRSRRGSRPGPGVHIAGS